MACPNIDAVERYISRIEDFVNDKYNQDKMYKPTLKRLQLIRNIMVTLCQKIDVLLHKFDESNNTNDKETYDDSVNLNSDVLSNDNDSSTNLTLCENVAVDVNMLRSIVSSIVEDKLANKKSKVKSTINDQSQIINNPSSSSTTHRIVDKDKSNNNIKILNMYKEMFETSIKSTTGIDLVDRTNQFLYDWFKTKILGFKNIRKVDKTKTYNIDWIPLWIRDLIIYIGNNSNKIEDVFSMLYDFLDAPSTDTRFTNIVPYEVAQLGINKDRSSVSEISSALWYQLFDHTFANLALPNDSKSYCSQSLIDNAYLTEDEINKSLLTVTPSFIDAVNWVNNYQFKSD